MRTKVPTGYKINGLVTTPLNVNNHTMIFVTFCFLYSRNKASWLMALMKQCLEFSKSKKRPAERSPSPGPQKRKPFSLPCDIRGRRHRTPPTTLPAPPPPPPPPRFPPPLTHSLVTQHTEHEQPVGDLLAGTTHYWTSKFNKISVNYMNIRTYCFREYSLNVFVAGIFHSSYLCG